MLVERDGCVYDRKLLEGSRGYERLDSVGREAFVNHLHLDGDDQASQAREIIDSWSRDLRQGWPNRCFRIYMHTEDGETTVRFQMVRSGVANWADSGVEIIEVGP